MRDTLYTHSLSRLALTSAARTNGTVNGTTIDLGVYGNDFRTALFVITTGAITDGTHVVTLEHSSDNSNWSAVPAGRIQGTAPSVGSADDNVVFDVGYIVGTEQYVRLVVTTSGATTGGIFSAVAVLGQASSSPVARA